MNKVKFQLISIILALIVSACGAQATPSIDAVSVQNTAVAAAFTMVAQTQAAIPTATSLPPTDTPAPTPIPTDTAAPLPTTNSEVLPTLEPTQGQSSSNSNTNPCLAPLNMAGAGPKHPTVIKNEIKKVKTFTLSLQLYIPNAFGACGVIPAGAGTYGLPSGSWYALAWVTLKNGKSFTTSGNFYVQPAQFDKLVLCVRDAAIVYAPSC